jgi:glutamate synthase domain-containing protein 3
MANPNSYITLENDIAVINAEEMTYRELNRFLRELARAGIRKVKVKNVYGQRYIGAGLSNVEIEVYGTPGNDLGAFMDGPSIIVYGNAQDGCGNTMNSGKIVIYGKTGDVTGYSMRGGKIFIRDNTGYRVGIHMKEFDSIKPQIVIGGCAGDFLGEYMAGGVILVLGLNLHQGRKHSTRFIGAGMHGGVIYIRGEVGYVGKETKLDKTSEEDLKVIHGLVKEFCTYFKCDLEEIMNASFTRITPVSNRPYKNIYAYL